MNNQYIKYILAASVLLIIGTIFIYFRPQKTDWSASFSSHSKAPYGTFVIKKQLNDLFPNQKIKENFISYYTFFKDQNLENDKNSNLIIISKSLDPDPLETKRLIDYVIRGNKLFIASSNIQGKLADTLKLSYAYALDLLPTKNDDAELIFTNKYLKTQKPSKFKHIYQLTYFDRFDTLKTSLLGTDIGKRVVFIEIKIGLGTIYLHTLPAVFSNYGLLYNNNHEYAEKCLSYLPQQTIIWDEYFKPDRVTNQSLIRFLMTDNALQTAVFFLSIGLLLFLIFASKRKQRMVELIKPNTNTSLEFIHTVGRLYYRRRNNLDLVNKQYMFLLDHLRTHYQLTINTEQPIDIQSISQKTGIKLSIIMEVMGLFSRLIADKNVSDSDLIELNHLIEKMREKEI